MALTTAQVTSLLQNVLFESSTIAGQNAASWVALSNNSAYSTISQMATAMASPLTVESTISQEVARMYLGVLGRTPDAAGMTWWTQYVESGLSANQISTGASAISSATWGNLATQFINSTEFQSHYAGINDGAFVTLLYQNVLGRSGDAAGMAYWTGVLAAANNSAAAMAQVVQGFVNSTEFINDTQSPISSSLVTYGTAVAGGSTTATIGTITPTTQPGQSFTMTTGVDTITATGSNNTITATQATLTALDSINFGSTTGNTINVTDTGTGGVFAPTGVAGVTVSGVQTATVTSAEAVTFNATGSQGWTGLSKLTVASTSDGANVDTITVGNTTAVTVNDTAGTTTAVTGNLTVNGGTNVAITESNQGINNAKTITVLGGTGTTTVSVVQTESAAGNDQAVTITDTNQAGGTKAGVINSVTLDGLDTKVAAINDSALTSLTVNNVSAGTPTVTITQGAYTSPATTLALSVYNDTAFGLIDAGSKYTTLNVTTGAKASTLATGASSSLTAVTALTVGGSSVLTLSGTAANVNTSLSADKTITISDSAGLTGDLSSMAALTSVTSTSSGVVTLTLNGTQETFTGGSGQDVITIGAAATKAIAGGTATNNELVWNAAAATTFGTVSGFTTLGVAGSSTGSFDMSKLTGYNSFDVQGTTGGAVSFTKVTAGSPLSIDANDTQAVVYQTADTAGATDSLTLTLGTSATTGATGVTAASVTVGDSVFNGIGNLTIVSNDSTAASVNVITAFSDASLSTLTVQGNSGLTLGAFNDAASSLTINGNSTGTGTITLQGITGTSATALNTVTVTGTDAVAITSLTETGTSFTFNDSASAAVSIATLVDSSATTETFTNTGSKALTVGSTAHTGAALTTINLNGNVVYTATADAVTSGVTVNGSTDNAVVTLTISGATASGKVDTITLGNGNNVISDAVSTAGTANITVGTGSNSITVGTQTANITLGTHTATTGADTIVVGANASTTVLTTVTGAVAGDHIQIADATAQALVNTTAANVAAAGGDVTTLAGWVTGSLAAAGANIALHQVAWFNFQGNTYFVEQSAAAGTAFGAGDTLVKLVGTYNEAAIGAVSAGHQITLV